MVIRRNTKSNKLFKKGIRRCHICRAIKPLSMFYKNKTIESGYGRACKKCKNEGVKTYRKSEEYRKADATRATQYRKTNKDKLRNKRYLKQYGISYDDKIVMLVKQHYRCIICGKKIDGVSGHTDHCHKKKKVRGLLCSNCNTGIGLFNDDVELLEEAIKYLDV